MQKKEYDEVKRFVKDRDTGEKLYTNLLTEQMAHE